MNEENKINERYTIKTIYKYNKYKRPNELKEVHLKKKSPGFNLVSLKARHRLNIFKQILSKYEYKDYIRKCKNMYSISSLMNNQYSMSDLYLSERSNMPDIINLYNKIDSKLGLKKIKFGKIKKIKNINSNKNKLSLSGTNIFGNYSTKNEMSKDFSQINKRESFSESKKNFFFQRKYKRIKTICYNVKKVDLFSLRDKIRRNSLNDRSMNIKTTYKLQKLLSENNIKNKILSYNDENSLKDNKNKNDNSSKKIHSYNGPNNMAFSPLLPKFKIRDKNNTKNKSYNKIILKEKPNNDLNAIKSIKLKKFPLSNKNRCYSITHFGAIIYNNSIFRNKGIERFLPQYDNLPLLYNNSICKKEN